MVTLFDLSAAKPRRVLGMMTLVAVVLFFGFRYNSWSAANQSWFDSFLGGPEGLVLGRLCKSRQDGMLSGGALTGATCAGLGRQYQQYYERTAVREFSPYRSQPGLQASIFSVIEAVSPLTAWDNLALYHSLSAGFAATVIALLIAWFYLELGPLAAAFATVGTAYSQWMTVMGRSLWWCMGAFYLPVVMASFMFRREAITGRDTASSIYVPVALAVLLKCLLNGFEFITTTVVMPFVPLVYYAIVLEWSGTTLRQKAVKTAAGILVGGAVALTVLALQLSVVDGTMADGWCNIWDCFWRRTVGRQVVYGAAGRVLSTPDIATTLVRYGKSVAMDFNPLLESPKELGIRPTLQIDFRQLAFLVLGASGVALWKARRRAVSSGSERKIVGMVAATWTSALAPLTWLVLFMGHSTVHFHLDPVVWHMPFALYGFAVVGMSIRGGK